MINKPKFKATWKTRPNNSFVLLEPNSLRVQTQRLFMMNFNLNYNSFNQIIRCQALPFERNGQLILINDPISLQTSISQLLQDQYIIFHIINEKYSSYKGFISWIIIGNRNHAYLIDAITLRNQINNLGKVFQCDNIVKFMFNREQNLNWIKRDFQVFPINIFGLRCLNKLYNNQLYQYDQEFKEIINEVSSIPDLLCQRPIPQKLMRQFSRIYNLLLIYTTYLPKRTISTVQGSQIQPQQYYNNIQEKYQKYNSAFTAFTRYQHCVEYSVSKQYLDNLTPYQIKLFYGLIQFREHVAKINDVWVGKVIPAQVLMSILANSKVSVLEISQLYENSGTCYVGLELCKRIYDIIQLNNELFQDSNKIQSEILLRDLSSKKQIDTNYKKLLKQIQWGDSIQWLNRKDDPSLKLYKEIISIDQFDHSIGEEYLNMVNGQYIKKSQFGKYVKYAEYMRNRNYEKLERFYQMGLMVKQSNKEDQFSQENQDDILPENSSAKQFGRKLFEDEESECPKSCTSLDERITLASEQNSNKNIKSAFLKTMSSCEIQNNEENSQNSRSRKSSSSSTMNISDVDEQNIRRCDIPSLPNSIQEIYQLAQQVKKKADKKVNKKKEKKGKQFAKEVDFVPSWQDIQNLIKSANNLN